MGADETTLRMLERLVAAEPAAWDARAHLLRLLLAAGRPADAVRVLDAAPAPPPDTAGRLVAGAVLEGVDRARAIAHYRALLDEDRACAAAHVALARLYRVQGMRPDARRHYGIATVIDESLADPELERWLDEGADALTPAPAPASEASPGPPRPAAPLGVTHDGVEHTGEDEPPEASRRPPTADELQEAFDAEGGRARLPKVTFADVGGLDALKEQIRLQIVYPFKDPETFRRYKRRAGGGILLYGPPGCGKTYVARATAGECEARFVSVRISDVLSRWLGESEQRLAAVFEQARRRAPTVVFLDEVDALGMDRRSARGGGISTLVNSLLSELDGVDAGNDGVLVLAATNAPWQVDPALRRPGRFDRLVFVPPPDAAAREAILRLLLRDVPHEEPDWRRLVETTRKFSGADLRAVVERAADAAIVDEMKTGRRGSIRAKTLLDVARNLKPSTLDWLSTAKDYASYANQGGGYDDVARWLESPEGKR